MLSLCYAPRSQYPEEDRRENKSKANKSKANKRKKAKGRGQQERSQQETPIEMKGLKSYKRKGSDVPEKADEVVAELSMVEHTEESASSSDEEMPRSEGPSANITSTTTTSTVENSPISPPASTIMSPSETTEDRLFPTVPSSLPHSVSTESILPPSLLVFQERKVTGSLYDRFSKYFTDLSIKYALTFQVLGAGFQTLNTYFSVNSVILILSSIAGEELSDDDPSVISIAAAIGLIQGLMSWFRIGEGLHYQEINKSVTEALQSIVMQLRAQQKEFVDVHNKEIEKIYRKNKKNLTRITELEKKKVESDALLRTLLQRIEKLEEAKVQSDERLRETERELATLRLSSGLSSTGAALEIKETSAFMSMSTQSSTFSTQSSLGSKQLGSAVRRKNSSVNASKTPPPLRRQLASYNLTSGRAAGGLFPPTPKSTNLRSTSATDLSSNLKKTNSFVSQS